jgi:hypothetical protein
MEDIDKSEASQTRIGLLRSPGIPSGSVGDGADEEGLNRTAI